MSPGVHQRWWFHVLLVLWISALLYGGAVPRINDLLSSRPLPIIWFLRWQMFGNYVTKHRMAFFEGQQADGSWHLIDHTTIFRYRYDSGLRFDRPETWRSSWWSRRRQRLLVEYVCTQYNQQHPMTPVRAVRVGNRFWKKRLGEVNQTPRGQRVQTKLLRTTRCH